MTLSDVSIKNPVFAWMLMAALVIFGGICFSRMGLSQLPDVDFPVVNISLTLEGASPEIMESDVADVVEDAVMGVQGVKQVTTTCKEGSANVSVELDLNRDVDVALQEIQTKVAQAQRSLPTDLDPPSVSKFNPEDQPILWVAVSSDRPVRELMMYVKDQLKDNFQTIPGVGEVFLGGYVDRNLRVWLDGKKLSQSALTVDDVINTVSKEHVEVPAGRIEAADREMNVRVLGEAPSVEAFGNLPINSRGGAPVYNLIRLKQVADLEDGLDDVRRISRYNGEPAVGLGIRKQRGANAVEVARAVRAKMEEVAPKLPKGYQLRVSFDSTRFVEDSIKELEITICLSALLTGLVCWLFLRSWSSTVNIFLAIPTSILGAFIILYSFGFTLNTFTLLGLSLAIGVVVDDAIMVLENIVRRREMGENRVQGALNGARQITFAATATTFSIVAIFLPVFLMKGAIGKFFFQFGVTISAAVLLSLLEALTLTPMRCSQFLQIKEQPKKSRNAEQGKMDRVTGFYARHLGWCLNHRWWVLAGAALFFGSTFFLMKFVKKEFIPYQDQSQLMVRLQTPIGSSIGYTDSLVKKCEEYLKSRGESKGFYVAVGGFGGGDVNTAIMFTTLLPPGKRPIVEEPLFKGGGWPKGGAKKSPAVAGPLTPGMKSAAAPPTLSPTPSAPAKPEKLVKRRLGQEEFSQVLRRDLSKISPDLKVVVQDLSMRGFSSGRGFPIELTIKGSDWDILAKSSQEIEKRLEASGKAVDVDTNYLLGQPEVQVVPDRDAASRRGVSVNAIGNVIGAMMGGRKAGKFTEGGHRYDVRVRLKLDQRLTSKDISGLFVRNNRGELVRLSEVVKLVEHSSLQSITRLNRERAISLYGNPAPGITQQVALDEAMKIAKEVLPEGYKAELSGNSKSGKESSGGLLFAMLLGIMVAYMILGSQFNSFLHPVTVLLALPFSFTGAILALLISGNSLNMYSFIGLILLMGLVKKNSIMLVDFTNQMRAQGMGVQDALLKACPIRLRPILMTSIATIAGAIPPALALGPGGELRAPMAIAVIGGVIVSTLLTLVVVPCAYSLFSRLERQAPHSFETQEAPKVKKSAKRA